jgi:Bacteriophage probable baseplate hub protein
VTELFFSTTAPVFKVDGDVKGDLARDVLRLEVEETTQGLKSCRAYFLAVGPSDGASSGQLQYLDGTVVDFGKAFEVSLGPTGNERVIFKGAVYGLEVSHKEGEPPQVMVFAEDKLMKLRMTRRTKIYEQVSDADIATAIAREHGLTPDPAADGPTYDRVMQANQSDLAFLRARAARVQAEIWCDGDQFNFKTRANREGTEVTLVLGNHLLQLTARADLAHQRTKVVVSGYDASQRAAIEREAGDEAVQAEVTGGRTGPGVLLRAFGERVSHLVREVPLVDGEATAWAKGKLLERARSFVVVHGTTRGTPDMVVGSRITLERVGSAFEGAGYYATRVRHTYDLQDGHRTHFEAERPTVSGGAS